MKAYRILTTTIIAFTVFVVSDAMAGTEYLNKVDFLANAGSLDFESFEDFSPVDTDLTVLNLGDFSITNLNPDSDELIVEDTDYDVHATHGSQYVYWFVFDFGGGLQWDFSSQISAFAFTLTDPVDWEGQITFSNNAGESETIVVGSLPDSSEIFWGFVSDFTFDTMEILHTSDFDAVGIDEVYYTPEPATVLILGLGGLVLRRRKR